MRPPVTIGDYLRKTRLERKLSQPKVAKIIGVTASIVTYWELNQRIPTVKKMPKIVSFIGYFPFEWKNESLKTQINYAKMMAGHSVEDMAQEIGCHPCTITNITREKTKPHPNTLENILKYINKYLVIETQQSFKDKSH